MAAEKRSSTVGCVAILATMLAGGSAAHAGHRLGTVYDAGAPLPFTVGPGDDNKDFIGADCQFQFLHFNSDIEGTDQVVVDLGYDTDVFDVSSGAAFWSRPAGGTSLNVQYLDDGDGVGSATVFEYGCGENGVDAFDEDVSGDVFLIDNENAKYMEPTSTVYCVGVCPDNGCTNNFPEYPSCQYSVCGTPDWEPVDCLDDQDPDQAVMLQAASATGIFISAEEGAVSSCTAALIDENIILTAFHCVDFVKDIESASFTLDFQLDCNGNDPQNYDPTFYKLKAPALIRDYGLDYSIIQLETGPPVTPVELKPLSENGGVPEIDEEIFIIHHPRGTPKKVSRPGNDVCTVSALVGDDFRFSCDIDAGSSGSPIYDFSGRLIGITSNYDGSCGNGQGVGSPTIGAVQSHFLDPPTPDNDADVVAVIDRSGSMLQMVNGQTKLAGAQSATATFIDLLSSGATHRVGLVSYDETATPDFMLSAVSDENKETLIGPPPDQDEGIVGGLMPDCDPLCSTSIGGGLALAQAEFPMGPDENDPQILLLTDGLQNTAPLIEDVDLGQSRVCAVGFGDESSLNGELLTELTNNQGGIYTRADTGLLLQKFFVLCFGKIFTDAVADDPFFTIPAGTCSPSERYTFELCEETELTLVIGWERPEETLDLRLFGPGGVVIDSGTAGITASSGQTWAFLRVPLPFGGNSAGTWGAEVTRRRCTPGSTAPNVDNTFFASTLVNGGPTFDRVPRVQRLYTGDAFNPLVALRAAEGGRGEGTVTVIIERPEVGTGNILTESGLVPGDPFEGDEADPRIQALRAVVGTGTLPTTTVGPFALFDDAVHEDGATEEHDGTFGNPLEGITLFEGNYTATARAQVGEDGCFSSREAVWTEYVALGIDATQSTGVARPVPNRGKGPPELQVTVVPRDVRGSFLGPGRADAFTMHGMGRLRLVGLLQDNGDGSYTQEAAWDPRALRHPRVEISQPGREPVLLSLKVGRGGPPGRAARKD